jgi:folylpolyglutamate synthase/dihydropteroate synthase
MAALFSALRESGFARPVTLAAIMSDKAAAGLIDIMGAGSRAVVFSGVNSPRAIQPEKLARAGLAAGYESHAEKSAVRAFKLARNLALANNSPLLVTGSFYLAAEIKAIIKRSARPVFPCELAP